MKRTINRFLSSNLALRILSVILSVCLWLLVINTNDPDTTRTFSNVDVTIRNENLLTDQGRCYRVTEGDKISFSIKGKKSMVDKIKKTDFDVYADFAELSSVNSVPIHIVAKKYSNIDIMNGNDKTMILNVEKTKTVKVPVSASVGGSPEAGYSVGEVILSPKALIITGAKSEVEQIDFARVNVDVTGKTKDILTSCTPVCYDKDGNKLDSSNWEFSVKKVEVKVTIGQSKKVPVKVKTKGSPLAGYQIALVECSPSKVQLQGKKEVLDQITEINLPDISVKNAEESIIKEIKASSIKLPKGASFLNEDQVFRVTVMINKEAVHGLKVSSSDISIEGKEENMEITLPEEDIILQFTGTPAADNELSVENLHPSINVAGLKEGTHMVDLKLYSISGLMLKENPQIRVNIRIKDNEELKDNEEDVDEMKKEEE